MNKDPALENQMSSLPSNLIPYMSILVQIKSVFGTDRIYPICDKAKTFADMVGQQTLTELNINHIKKLGFSINVIQQQPKTL